jgi:hypothetical protein
MINEKKIIEGTKEELVEYFYNITKEVESIRNDTTNSTGSLFSKAGISNQLDEFKSPHKIGMIFYMMVDKEPITEHKADINLKVESSYVRVMDEKIGK